MAGKDHQLFRVATKTHETGPHMRSYFFPVASELARRVCRRWICEDPKRRCQKHDRRGRQLSQDLQSASQFWLCAGRETHTVAMSLQPVHEGCTEPESMHRGRFQGPSTSLLPGHMLQVHTPLRSMFPWQCASLPGWWSSCPSAVCWKPKFRVSTLEPASLGAGRGGGTSRSQGGEGNGKESQALTLDHRKSYVWKIDRTRQGPSEWQQPLL